MKIIVFWFKFPWNLFPLVRLKWTIIGLDDGLAPNRRQAIIWTNNGLANWDPSLYRNMPTVWLCFAFLWFYDSSWWYMNYLPIVFRSAWLALTLDWDRLTHLPLVPHVCVSESHQHWLRLWLVAYSAPSHYLNQCWDIVNWTLGTNFSEISIKRKDLSFTKMQMKISSAKWQPFCPGGDELTLVWLCGIGCGKISREM